MITVAQRALAAALSAAAGGLPAVTDALSTGRLHAPAAAAAQQLTSLAALRGLSTSRKGSVTSLGGAGGAGDDDVAAAAAALPKGAHLPRVSRSLLASRLAAGGDAEAAGDDAGRAERQRRIQALLQQQHEGGAAEGGGGPTPAAAAKFVDAFFGQAGRAGGGGGGWAAAGAPPGGGDDGGGDGGDGGGGDGGGGDPRALQVSTPAPLSAPQEDDVLRALSGLRRGSQRAVLQRLLQGGMLRADPAAAAEWDAIQRAAAPPAGFRMRVVDVNRTSKGTRAGGLYRFGAMVVVGNGDGVLGWGAGKAAELSAAVSKAHARAARNLYPIPRFAGHTVPHRVEAKLGRVKVLVYPASSGAGLTAAPPVAAVLKLAGIHDAGVKVHGSRNPRNTIKCLFAAFDRMKTHEEVLASRGRDGRGVVVSSMPGRFDTVGGAAAVV